MHHFQIIDEEGYRRELIQVRKAREQLALAWCRLPDHQIAVQYAGQAGQIHRMLVARLLAEVPDGAGEQKQARRLARQLPDNIRGKGAIGRFLAAMLYNRAYELPQYYDLEKFPMWLLRDYLLYMTNSAFLFCIPGESVRYYQHMQRWVQYLHTSVSNKPNSSLWRKIADIFVHNADFGPLYFNDQDLLTLYAWRGDLIEYVLRGRGCTIDWRFDAVSERRPIRVGVLASHCKPSPESYALLPLVENSGGKYEVRLYVLHSGNSELENYCRSRVSETVVLGNDLQGQVSAIRQDDNDIMFVATNITSTCNPVCYLAAHRLARRQVAGPASVTTTGLRNMDYYLTGRLTDQPASSAHYRESMLWLKGPAHCFSYGPTSRSRQVPVSRAMLEIPESATVYVSGANIFKILPELMRAWGRILGADKDSLLMLYPYGPNWSGSYPREAFNQRLKSFLKEEGVSPGRLYILDPHPVPDRYQIREYLKVADVYLDSFPFSATTSLIEPLEVGLPIVSRTGEHYRSSMGGALLKSVGMDELVVENIDDYVALAQRLGKDVAYRDELSLHIRQAMNVVPSFLDSAGYASQAFQLFGRIAHDTGANN